MKKFLLFISAIFMCVICRADTFYQHWYVEDNTPIQTSCTTGGDIILPTPPTKYGYDFIGWEQVHFTRIEYLESTGAQWIDTGVVLTNNISFVATVGTNVRNIVGFRRVPSGIGIIVWQDSHEIQFRDPITTIGSGVNYSLKNLYNIGFNIDKTYFVVNNTYIRKTFDISSDGGTIATGIYDIIASLKIYDNDVLVRDFIPVLDIDGIPCMFDKVEGKFYYNQGTGQFIAGPVIGSGE